MFKLPYTVLFIVLEETPLVFNYKQLYGVYLSSDLALFEPVLQWKLIVI